MLMSLEHLTPEVVKIMKTKISCRQDYYQCVAMTPHDRPLIFKNIMIRFERVEMVEITAHHELHNIDTFLIISLASTSYG